MNEAYRLLALLGLLQLQVTEFKDSELDLQNELKALTALMEERSRASVAYHSTSRGASKLEKYSADHPS